MTIHRNVKYERLPSLAEHSCSVYCYIHHPGWHDASHPLCEGRPRVAACHWLLGDSGVIQLCLRPWDNHIHWDGQDQGYCHQWSHLHGESVSVYLLHAYVQNSYHKYYSYVSLCFCKLTGLMSNAYISASNHLLPLRTAEGPLRT